MRMGRRMSPTIFVSILVFGKTVLHRPVIVFDLRGSLADSYCSQHIDDG